jgi:hypothetical protein
MSQSTMHQWARYYAGLGWHVFPLVPGTKSPFKGSKGSSEATTNLVQIDKWWSANPDANIGTRPSAGGLYVFDVDPRNGGSESFEGLQKQYGAIGSLLRVNSPGGGFHLYFSAPQRQDAAYSSQPAMGIDGKYNGYAALPPSRHPNGGLYEWASDLPSAVRADPIPQWLVQVRTPRAERPAVDYAGKLDDVELIMQALNGRDPDDYHSWEQAIASVRHWEEHTEGADGIGYELARQWSEQSDKHDDGAFEDKWNNHDSFRPGARGLGSLLHEAGMTAAQRAPIDAAAVFSSFPPVIAATPRPIEWTTAPVEHFKGSSDPAEVVADLMNNDTRDFNARWAAGDVGTLLDDICWRAGGNCQVALEALCLHQAIEDCEELRAWIAHNCATRTTWATVGRLTADQIAAGCERVSVDDGALVSAHRAILKALPLIPNLFLRYGELVRVKSEDGGQIQGYDVHSLSHELETHIRFEKGGKGSPTKCPEALVRRVMSSVAYPGLHNLSAVTPLPVARADGSVVTAQGIDPATGLYLLKGSDRPARLLQTSELGEALGRIWAPFALFPYESAAARGTMLAALLTCVCRVTLPTAPAFLINAQIAGSGKSRLSESLMIAACAAVKTSELPKEPAEQSKMIMAALLQGPRGLIIDNLIGSLKPTGALCAAMTSSEYSARGLGGLKMVSAVNRAVWVLNGNNIALEGDLVRRVLTVGLESPENPEARQFDFDPREMIGRNVEAYRADLLDVLHTYSHSGAGKVAGGFASFEEWNQLVRGCVLWLISSGHSMFADPLDTMREAQEEDAERLQLTHMIKAWQQRFGNEPVYLRDVGTSVLTGTPEEQGLWLDTYTAICTYQGRFDAGRLTYWLRRNKNRKCSGMMFCNDRDRDKVARWKVVPA